MSNLLRPFHDECWKYFVLISESEAFYSLSNTERVRLRLILFVAPPSIRSRLGCHHRVRRRPQGCHGRGRPRQAGDQGKNKMYSPLIRIFLLDFCLLFSHFAEVGKNY